MGTLSRSKSPIPHPPLAVLEPPDPVRARALAARLQLPLAAEMPTEIPWVLIHEEDRLKLAWTGPQAPGPVEVDWVAGATAHRWRGNPTRRQPLLRALGQRTGVRTVFDATAGLGRDAFVAACAGLEVLAVERVGAIAALLEDGARRAAAHPETRAALGGRLSVRWADAHAVLAELAPDRAPDAVYLDPMFPERRKSAKVKKEMQLFQALVGDDSDAAALLAMARTHARRRCVVKRPLHAPPLGGTPDAVVRAARVRWDVYLTG